MTQIPTVGRIVHFFPGSNDPSLSDRKGAHPTYANNSATVLPAIVLQVFGTAINLMVFTCNQDTHTARRYSVQHKDTALQGTYEDGVVPTYWDWPEIVTFTPPVGSTTLTIPHPDIVSQSTTDGNLTFKSFSQDNGNQQRA